MHNKRIFVTVGTTKFEKLIETITREDVLNKLTNLGYKEIQLQIGNGVHKEVQFPSLQIKYDQFFENFTDEINKCDLVISHAGAGTCLEVLKIGKPLIIVINEDLMDNHQMELAEQLQSDNYVYFCTCKSLKDTLGKDLTMLRKYPKTNKTLFSSYLNKCMGFA